MLVVHSTHFSYFCLGGEACREAAASRQNEKARVEGIVSKVEAALPDDTTLTSYRACRDQLPTLLAEVGSLPEPHKSKLEGRIKELTENGEKLERDEKRRVTRILESARDIIEEAEDGFSLGLYQELKDQMAKAITELATLPQNMAAKVASLTEQLQVQMLYVLVLVLWTLPFV